MMNPKRPKELAQLAHQDYYRAGDYPEDRFLWTIKTFLDNCRGKRILEVGCGDGKFLSLLQAHNEVCGVDVSESGVRECNKRGIPAFLLDVSSEPLPFPDSHLDIVICLETMEHLMNPYYALLEIRRVLIGGGRFICSVPNPWTGHPYLYPGLFEFKYFYRFLQQHGFRILRVAPWQWAPRETILPRPLRRSRILCSRYVAGAFRRLVERLYRAVGLFPWFCYWLWTFDCMNENKHVPTILEVQAHETMPKGR